MSVKILILLPFALLVVFALCRMLVGRALPKRSFDILLALVLLLYFLATAGLGLFWVANQELPVFDWHYLVGYVTLVLVVLHVAFNWRTLMAFLRRRSAKALPGDSRRTWRPALRTASWVAGLALYGAVFYWLGKGQAVTRIEITRGPSATMEEATVEPAAQAGAGDSETAEAFPIPEAQVVQEESLKGEVDAGVQEAHAQGARAPQAEEPHSIVGGEVPPAKALQQQVVSSEGRHRALADYYHEQTKHTRISVMGGGGALDWSAKPAVFKPYPRAEVIDLPEPTDLAGISVGGAIELCRRPVPGLTTEPITLEEVSTILFMTNGVTSTLARPNRLYRLRAAPSAGALYPTITYLVARNVRGLDVGIYHYAVKDHKLHRLRHGGAPYEELASAVSRPELVSRAPVTFIFTSSFYRSSWKYGERSYRYCCLDAGHLVVQASLAAAGLGFGSVPIGRFDDERVNAFLGLDEDEEGAMAILPVGFVDHVSSGPEGRPEFDLAPKELEGRSHALVRLMHGSTRLAMTGRTVQAFPARTLLVKELVEPVVHVLPANVAEGDDLFSTILRRRSIRTWSGAGLILEELAAMAYYACGLSETDGEVWPDPTFEDNHALNLYVIINEVDELEPGVYHYDRSHHALAQIRRGDHRQQVYASSLFQDVVGEAHVAFVMTADLKRLGYPDGDRGYRYANLDAGMLGGRLYLMATGLNLGCCGIGAYFDDEVSELIDVSPEEELVLYLAAVGVPEEVP